MSAKHAARASSTGLPAVAALALATCARAPAPEAVDDRAAEREQMVLETIEPRGVADRAVLAAMRAVPRHAFIPADRQDDAYADRPLDIGRGQTISQPYIVARMTELAEVKRGDKVLEVGTGSGYQAAVLAAMGARVFSIEIVDELARSADARLKQLRYDVVVRAGDGWQGWPDEAPFDAILVTAAPEEVPPALIAQLKDGGRLVIPVGPQRLGQSLRRLRRAGDQIVSEDLLDVRFVPMTGGTGGTGGTERTKDTERR